MTATRRLVKEVPSAMLEPDGQLTVTLLQVIGLEGMIRDNIDYYAWEISMGDDL